MGQRLQAGLSVTDPCLGQAETASLLDEIAAALK
ncbi:MAG TPA: phospho-2-dehydro-3-deoxyheptonate aldolase [Spirochaetaceae bacterium]|nr:phospho-2-dehydro-3-deoxyheptonate aldolase [Spirochaetaceae bacterium]